MPEPRYEVRYLADRRYPVVIYDRAVGCVVNRYYLASLEAAMDRCRHLSVKAERGGTTP